MTEQEALNLVLRNGKREYIYSDDYKRLYIELGSSYIDLRSFCKQQGSEIKEWLISRGIYCDIERDMRDGKGTFDPEGETESICAQIFDNYPLVGEPVLPEKVLSKLFARAQIIFDGIAENGGSDLSNDEKDIIAIAIVQFIKQRNFQEEGKSDKQFWPYIYSQFGYKQDNDGAGRIYSALRDAVKCAFLRHARYWSSEEKTQQYYTSLMLHALSPVQSMESLFEILFYFYTHDLEFAYVPEDPIFKALVNCIASRWDKGTELQKELNLRSNALASGLKALFSDRRNFMRVYCEHIVKQIDALVRGIDALDPDRSTLDILLRQWYLKREEALKDQVARERSISPVSGRSAVSVESIRLHYVLDNRRVCISIPPIRLEDVADDYPLLELFQGKNRIYTDKMEVYGRLSWTTRGLLLPLDDTDIDYGEPLNIEASITYNGDPVLDRDSKLHRPFIVFNDGGREVSSQTNAAGAYYLFAGNSAHIDPGTIDPERIEHDGQLMRLYVDGSSPVYIDGTELFVSSNRQEDVRCYPTIPRINELRGRREGGTFNVYPAAFKLDIRLAEGKQSLYYRIFVDNRLEPLTKYCEDSCRAFVLDVPNTPVKYHSIQIVEQFTRRVACSFGYVILPNVKCSLESELIYDDGSPTTVRVHYDGCDITSREYPVEGTDWVTLSAEHLDYDLEARLPLVRGTLLGQNAFELPSAIWREKISDAAFVNVQCPPDWNSRLYLGTTVVPQNAVDGSYELGNFIKTCRNRDKSEALTLMMKNTQGLQDTRTLTRIVFEEYFTESPVSMENGALMWHPEDRYFGGKDDEFRLVLNVPGKNHPFNYSLNMKNGVVDRSLGLEYPCEEFNYTIIKITDQRKSLFGKNTDLALYQGTLATGTPEQRRVKGKYLYLTKARCWDWNVNRMVNLEMPGTAGCLCNLQYQGNSVPEWEAMEYPEYIGELYFYNQSAQDWQYFNDQDRPGFERINPVRVWIISEQMLILRTPDGEEAPLIDRQYNSIVNKKLDLPSTVLYNRIITPDYFEYRME